jgi:hypothetical protein
MALHVHARRPAPAPPPDTNIGSVPRDVELSGDGRVLAGLAVLLAAGALAAGVGLGLLHVRQADEHERLSQQAVRTTGEVVRVAMTRGEHRRRVVTYEYEAAGVRRVATDTLHEGDGRPLAKGATIPIDYLASEPRRSWVAGNEPDVLPLFVAPLVSAFLLLGAWTIWVRLRRALTLLREGRLAEGRVVATKRVSGQHSGGYRVTYEFKTLAGALARASSSAGRKPPPVGERVLVIYHRDQPHWSALYPLSLVRPARR